MLPVTRRSWLRLAGLGSAAAATIFGTRRISGAQPQSSHGAMEHAAHRMGPVGRVSHRSVQPVDVSARLELLGPGARRAGAVLQGDASSRRNAASRVSDRRRRSRDRNCARRLLSGLDVQRPGARSDHPRDGRRSTAHHVHQLRFASAHDALPWLASSRNGWVDARTPGDARRALRLRVRCRAVRHASLPLPRRSPEATPAQGPLRCLHRRPTAAAPPKPTSS